MDWHRFINILRLSVLSENSNQIIYGTLERAAMIAWSVFWHSHASVGMHFSALSFSEAFTQLKYNIHSVVYREVAQQDLASEVIIDND